MQPISSESFVQDQKQMSQLRTEILKTLENTAEHLKSKLIFAK